VKTSVFTAFFTVDEEHHICEDAIADDIKSKGYKHWRM